MQPKVDPEEHSDALLSEMIQKRRANAAALKDGGKLPKLEPYIKPCTTRSADTGTQQSPATKPSMPSEDGDEF